MFAGNKGVWIVAALCACGTSLAQAATLLSFQDSVTTVLNLSPQGRNGLNADLDGDGFDDFVFGGGTTNGALMVVGRLPDAGIGFKQVLDLSLTPASINSVLLARRDGAAHVYVVSNTGVALDFAGWPLHMVNTFPIPNGALSAAIGDLNSDGGAELLVGTASGVHAFDADSGAALWTFAASYPYALAVAQLDDDPAQEIIVGSSPSFVLDGATQAVDWAPGTFFGYVIDSGRIGSGGTMSFAASDTWKVDVYKVAPWSLDWSPASTNTGFGALMVADLDHNGKDVILVGDAQFGSVHIYDPSSHLERAHIANPGSGTHGLAVGDVDGDGVPEILIIDIANGFGTLIQLVDSQSGAIKWSFAPLSDGGFSAVALGDVDGDGKLELVVAGANERTYGPGSIAVYDASNGALKWRSTATGSVSDPFVQGVNRILLLPHSADTAQDIVLFGNTPYDGRIVALDGLTHTVRLDIFHYGSGPLADRDVVNGAMVDVDNDGVLDFVAASRYALNSQGGRLTAFSGVDGHLLFDQAVGTDAAGSMKDVLVSGPGSDPASELIAVLQGGLFAYNTRTQAATWSLLASADGAALIPNGVSGAELAVFSNAGNVAFYDRTSRAFLRSFMAEAPLTALTSLDGTANALLLASGNRLKTVDGSDGATLAASSIFQPMLARGNELAVSALSPGQWAVAAGDSMGAYRFDVVPISDEIFGDGFGG